MSPLPPDVQLAFLEISLALALLAYGIWRDNAAFIQDQGTALVATCIVVDVLALVYAACYVQTVAALVNTVRNICIYWQQQALLFSSCASLGSYIFLYGSETAVCNVYVRQYAAISICILLHLALSSRRCKPLAADPYNPRHSP